MNKLKLVVLHCCCAPCSCAVIEQVRQAAVEPHLFFYNPNIHPREEYERRKAELVRYATKVGVAFTDGDYDVDRWLELVKGHELDPERGLRCSLCFEMRLQKAAEFAMANGFQTFATTLSISRWKDFEQVCGEGRAVAAQFPSLTYWDCNWRGQNGVQRMQEISTQEQFYRQKYCGCVFSLNSSKPADGWRQQTEP